MGIRSAIKEFFRPKISTKKLLAQADKRVVFRVQHRNDSRGLRGADPAYSAQATIKIGEQEYKAGSRHAGVPNPQRGLADHHVARLLAVNHALSDLLPYAQSMSKHDKPFKFEIQKVILPKRVDGEQAEHALNEYQSLVHTLNHAASNN